MHLNSSLLFSKYAIPYFNNKIRVLEVGPSGCPSVYQNLVNDPAVVWHTLDFKSSIYIGNAVDQLTYTTEDPYNFPVADESYDLVVSGQVIEHVQNIALWLKELKRIVKVGGHLIIINPVSWPYHEAPLDCWRIFPSGMESLAKDVGLTIVECLFDSLEVQDLLKLDKHVKLIPGRSYNYQDPFSLVRKKIYWNKIVRNIPFISDLTIPIEVSYDTISILRKP